MTTKEIIDCLNLVSFEYSRLTADVFPAGDIARDKRALTAAIQAVERLEEIKKELHGHCEACKHAEKHTYEPPCDDCVNCGPFDDDNTLDRWEFRWPLGEEADHETN